MNFIPRNTLLILQALGISARPGEKKATQTCSIEVLRSMDEKEVHIDS
jgi:hypothetical protein